MRDEATVVRDVDGQPLYWQGILVDITTQKLLEQRLAYQAFHDPLTDLPNRALFADRVRHALARAQRQLSPLAVLFVDLDNFKVVNDRLGHDAGDELLQTVAHRLRLTLRAGDTAARFGGDEFTILLEDLAQRSDALMIANRINRSISAPITVRGEEFKISASTGVVISATGAESDDELLRRADMAMYRAKASGKGRVHLNTAADSS